MGTLPRKAVLSMDGFDFSRDGIEHIHLPDFLLDDGEQGRFGREAIVGVAALRGDVVVATAAGRCGESVICGKR